MDRFEFSNQLSAYVTQGVPCFFLVDFEVEKPFVCPLEKAAELGVFYDIHGQTNFTDCNHATKKIQFDVSPMDEETYRDKFEFIKENLNNGNSYLLNLTFRTEIDTNLTFLEIFQQAKAPYKLCFKDEFVCFSPESFVQIDKEIIRTFPMKGTIDASVENAAQKLLANQKEEWEHNTIVDLLRNDLSMIAHDIHIEKYRFMDAIHTHRGEILQTSSEISGRLSFDWKKTFGQDFVKLLPAGSVSGAPKQKTVELIREAEGMKRGYYTGVFGVFDGQTIDSAVIIRYIERENECCFFRSGGGITSHSNVKDEYEELLQKIYIPTTRR